MKKYILLIVSIGAFFSSFQVISAQANEIETTIIDSVYSELLEEDREFWIKFPENYNPDSSTKYPVVYLLDGFSLKNRLETVY